jgi:hypothetical protein
LQVEEELNSSYYELHGLEINLTSDQISINRGDQNIYKENTAGKKVFRASPAENYFLIANYGFSNQKVDYPVGIRVFNRDGLMDLPFKFRAPYDLPHPIINVNDNGVLALFDPLNFKVKLISEESYNEIELEKDVPFEMEKASFVEIEDDFLFILTSQRALDVTENASNAVLYKVNLNDLRIDKKIIDYNTPTMLKIIGGGIYVSGVKFENLKPIGKTIKYDMMLNQLSSNDNIIEKLLPHTNKFYAKYFNVIYDLNKDLSISNEKKLSIGERILDFDILNERLYVISSASGKNYLYCFFPDLSIDFKAPLDNFGINNIEDLSVSGNLLIIHHESKSVKIKLNEN